MVCRSLKTFALVVMTAGAATAATTHFSGYRFEAYVAGRHHTYQERSRDGTPFIEAEKGAEYSVVIRNPLPVRVAVAVTVDGLNTIDGKRTSPENAHKWMIDPHGTITVRGWQTGSDMLRRFVFTSEAASYAEWKQMRDRKDYTANLGVIGVAWFWNSGELRDALRPVVSETMDDGYGRGCRSPAPSASAPAEKSRQLTCESESGERAGTGMGGKEQHRVVSVAFTHDAGMYSADDVLMIRYEFAKKAPRPRPFEDEGFAPDMYGRK